MAKALVTGATGFVGSAIVYDLDGGYVKARRAARVREHLARTGNLEPAAAAATA